MGAVAVRRRAACRPNRGVRCLGEWRARARHGASPSGHLRRGLLRVAGRRLPTACRDAELASRAYLVAGMQEPFFLENATPWADALRDAGADVVMTERVGSHGDAFWREEFPLMVAWAFGRRASRWSVGGHLLTWIPASPDEHAAA
jgi:hypothetical protein